MAFRERLFPELLLLDSRNARDELFAAAKKRAIHIRHWFLGYVIFTVVLVGASYLLAAPLNWLLAQIPGSSWISSTFMVWGQLVIPPIIALGLTVYSHRLLVRAIRELLNERGFLICAPCGYDLRGQSEPRCPECGTPFAAAALRNSDSASLIPEGPPKRSCDS